MRTTTLRLATTTRTTAYISSTTWGRSGEWQHAHRQEVRDRSTRKHMIIGRQCDAGMCSHLYCDMAATKMHCVESLHFSHLPVQKHEVDGLKTPFEFCFSGTSSTCTALPGHGIRRHKIYRELRTQRSASVKSGSVMQHERRLHASMSIGSQCAACVRMRAFRECRHRYCEPFSGRQLALIFEPR